jgi:hypothetical protein
MAIAPSDLSRPRLILRDAEPSDRRDNARNREVDHAKPTISRFSSLASGLI